VDSGRNLLLAASPLLSETTRSLASECGVDFDDKNTQVFDHFTNAGDHAVVASSNVVPAPVIVGSKVDAPVLFKGIAHTVPGEAELITVALSGNPTTYSADPKKGASDSPVAGTSTALVSLLQVGASARPGRRCAQRRSRSRCRRSDALWRQQQQPAHPTARPAARLGLPGSTPPPPHLPASTSPPHRPPPRPTAPRRPATTRAC
jgi:hypothetical protein